MFTVTVCPHCQAQNQPDAGRCWLCGAALGEEIVTAEVVGAGSGRSGASYTITALLVLVALVAIGIGFWDSTPGLTVLLLVVAAPAVMITLGRIHHRRRKGETISGWRTALDYLLSAVIVAVVVMGVGAIATVCLVAYLFYVCTQGFSH